MTIIRNSLLREKGPLRDTAKEGTADLRMFAFLLEESVLQTVEIYFFNKFVLTETALYDGHCICSAIQGSHYF